MSVLLNNSSFDKEALKDNPREGIEQVGEGGFLLLQREIKALGRWQLDTLLKEPRSRSEREKMSPSRSHQTSQVLRELLLNTTNIRTRFPRCRLMINDGTVFSICMCDASRIDFK